MSRKARKRNYENDLYRAERNSTADIVTALILFAASAGALAWLNFGPDIPDWVNAHRYALLSAGTSVLIYSLMKVFTALSEKRACRAVRDESVYAVRLKDEQQKQIARILSRQSACEHFTCFTAILAVLSVILVLSYIRRGNSSSLIVLAAAAVLGFAVTLLSYVRDIVRTASSDGFCTVSDKGIIQAGRIFPFSAENGDVSEIIRFSDYYSVRFITPGVLGLLVKMDFPLPRGGAVSRELIGADEESVLMSALAPSRFSEMEGPYRQIPFSREAALAEEEETVTALPDENVFLRIAAYAAVILLIAAAVIAANQL